APSPGGCPRRWGLAGPGGLWGPAPRERWGRAKSLLGSPWVLVGPFEPAGRPALGARAEFSPAEAAAAGGASRCGVSSLKSLPESCWARGTGWTLAIWPRWG